MTDTAEQLLKFIADETGMSDDEFDIDTPLFSEGHIDSFTMTAVIAFIEDSFNVKVDQSAITLENFDTVSNMAAFVKRESA